MRVSQGGCSRLRPGVLPSRPPVACRRAARTGRLRPLVVARKVCFGSQSEKGLKTRETLMSVIDTLKLRCDDPVRKLSGVFDALARDRDTDVSALLWGAARP